MVATESPSPSVAWSVDERYLVVGSAQGRGGYLIDVRRGKRVRVVTDEDYRGASFAPDGDVFAIVSLFGSADLIAVNAETRHQHSLGSGFAPVWGLAGLAFASDHRVLLRKRIERGVRTLMNSNPPAVPLDWSRDGTRLLVEQFPSHARSGYRAILVDPESRAKNVVPAKFTSIAELSRDGTQILGEQNRDVVSVGRSGRVRVLADRATHPSWSH